MGDSTNIKVGPLDSMLEHNGAYGPYGGAYIPPVLEGQLKKLADFFDEEVKTDDFKNEFIRILKQYVGRPSPLYYAKNLSDYVGSKIYLKREDLNHTGSHKINNCIGQILLAKKMGAKEIIAETGAGQHGVATATASAILGIPCKVFMGEIDVERQALNVRRMRLLGAEVIPTNLGSRTLKDAVDAALGYYIQNPESFYLLGSHVGPHPYPRMVGYFQSVIGNEARQQILAEEGKLPKHIFAAVGGGSNAIGLFSGFLADDEVEIHGAEGGGEGIYPNTAATLSFGKPAVFQGTMSYCLVDDEGNPIPSKSIAAGLDYPGISPQHAHMKDSGRAKYYPVTDAEAVEAYKLLSRLEGITPAIESSHAVALAMKVLKNKGELAIVNVSGRGDKDVEREM
ncbi:tryptophan synthase, beta chain [Pseudopedobacter saltans DSM 12145]|uniref:Tryptophan synthase beta chain n=1 Tax=Pseudopedobacter saltans (strain ATCC 51119 / DSM 12145 / JCM 21818 / CCUG 39354 / LMG 10337 / NBRC 100064 / NCIMB 13643) TaxID=762903 RepID=F0S6P0_PSESL|nr:tryptophan synthase subunit beta [Pseudopedobacter saltans]ADY51116.1 tryptophan synthase, beta chain [Pseudopedobacter saltans DSM 12145]